MKKLRTTIWATAFAAGTFLGLAHVQGQEYGEMPEAPAGKFSDAEKTILKHIDDAIARFDALLKTVTDVHEKAAVKNFLDAQKDRRFRLRPGFDTSVTDNLRLDVEIEYQRLVAWLAPMTPTRANRRDIRIPLPPVPGQTPANLAAKPAASAGHPEAAWVSHFDGKTLAGWRGYGRKDVPKLPFGWEVKDGVLHAIPADKGKKLKFDDYRQAELITEKKFTDYELSWDWKIAKGANSGVKYLVTEERPNAPGIEYQMADELGRTNQAADRSRLGDTGGFYAIIEPAADTPYHPAGEWNTSRIVVRGKNVEHYHNGKLSVAYELGSPQVKAGIAKSKFKTEPGFGEKIPGHIMLTYHGDEAWVRNIKIRELK
jgi:hypothetical protein